MKTGPTSDSSLMAVHQVVGGVVGGGCRDENDEGPCEKFFFEGTEKLLEIWFASSSAPMLTSAHGSVISGEVEPDLRRIERIDWERLLQTVNCEIISQKSNSSIISYVLSESSMFVSKNRLVLKTCGKTTLLNAIKPLLKLVYDNCGFDRIVDVFYSHKNYLRPELQPATHRKFDDEVDTLNEVFEDGVAYALGRINRDCWYLYTLDLIGPGVSQPDQTLEVMMTNVNRDVMSMFTQSYGLSADQLTKKTGIADLLPGALLDAFLFEPCGYSMNGILPNGGYFTIHITPEPEFSYVSFETNVPMESYSELIANVIDIFKPGKFLTTLLANEESLLAESMPNATDKFDEYKRIDHQFCQMKNYYLSYSQYIRSNINGLSPPQ